MATLAADAARIELGEPVRARPRASELLVRVVQELSLARDLPTIMQIVRRAARELTGADGATFVLREGDLCHYAEENAIAPLWKGRRFPMSACISGWVMAHGEATAIEDIYADPRVPIDAYRPTFVHSLAMVPIRARDPIGAIGNYWSTRHAATREELALLQALADSTSIAMENVSVYAELEQRVRDRTEELEAKSRELLAQHEALLELQRQKAALSALVVHDLRSPASAIMFSASMRLRADDLRPVDRRYWRGVFASAEHIARTAANLLDIASSHDGELRPKLAEVDVGALFAEVRDLLLPLAQRREQTISLLTDVPRASLRADPALLARVLQNLLDNALRHAPRGSTVRLEARLEGGSVEIAVSDEGPGIPAYLRDRILSTHLRRGDEASEAHSGWGFGLTFCRLAVDAHGGAIWIEDLEPRGTRFRIRLPLDGGASAGAARGAHRAAPRPDDR